MKKPPVNIITLTLGSKYKYIVKIGLWLDVQLYISILGVDKGKTEQVNTLGYKETSLAKQKVFLKANIIYWNIIY